MPRARKESTKPATAAPAATTVASPPTATGTAFKKPRGKAQTANPSDGAAMPLASISTSTTAAPAAASPSLGPAEKAAHSTGKKKTAKKTSTAARTSSAGGNTAADTNGNGNGTGSAVSRGRGSISHTPALASTSPGTGVAQSSAPPNTTAAGLHDRRTSRALSEQPPAASSAPPSAALAESGASALRQRSRTVSVTKGNGTRAKTSTTTTTNAAASNVHLPAVHGSKESSSTASTPMPISGINRRSSEALRLRAQTGGPQVKSAVSPMVPVTGARASLAALDPLPPLRSLSRPTSQMGASGPAPLPPSLASTPTAARAAAHGVGALGSGGGGGASGGSGFGLKVLGSPPGAPRAAPTRMSISHASGSQASNGAASRLHAVSPVSTSSSLSSALHDRQPISGAGTSSSQWPGHTTTAVSASSSRTEGGRGSVRAAPPAQLVPQRNGGNSGRSGGGSPARLSHVVPATATPAVSADAAAVAAATLALKRRLHIASSSSSSSEEEDEEEEEDEDEEGYDDDDEYDEEDEDEEDDDEGDSDAEEEEDEEDEEEEEEEDEDDGEDPARRRAQHQRHHGGGKARKHKSRRGSLAAGKSTMPPGAAATAAAVEGSSSRTSAGSATQPIRTKISREGDLNVKVIFATRTRHCFRRYLKEVMTRFGFEKVTDFDMYCIDQSGDRVDIDMEEDFEQLLDAFASARAATATGERDNPGCGSPRLLASPTPPPSVVAAQYLGKANLSYSSPTGVLESFGSADPATRHHALSSSASQQRDSVSFSGAKPFSLIPVLDATTASSVSAFAEDDGKSSGSVLRLYVRYSNAYYMENRMHFQPQQSYGPHSSSQGNFNGSIGPRPPSQGTHPSSAASFFTNQVQQLTLSPPPSRGDPQTDPFNGGSVGRIGLPSSVGSPLAHTLLGSTVDSSISGGAVVASRDDLCPVTHASGGLQTLAHPLMGSPGNVSQQFGETLRSSLANTFRMEEGEVVDWRRMSVLGKGSFGTVYEGITHDGKMLAVKVQEVPLDDEDADAAKALKTEINLMRSLKHKNIVAYYGCQTRSMPTGNQQMEVFLELCHGGSLASLRRKFVKAKEPFSISLVRSYTRQVLEGLAYLHAQHVVHRDIKSDNVLISAMGEAKLADFGCSKRLGPTTVQTAPGALVPGAVATPNAQEEAAARAAMHQTMVGSPFFMAPEVLREEGGYTGAADIWSVGCLVLELLGRDPWDVTGTNIFQIMFRISRETGMPTGVPKECPAPLLNFFDRCFKRDPKQRATASELLAHEWLTCPDRQLEEVPPPA